MKDIYEVIVKFVVMFIIAVMVLAETFAAISLPVFYLSLVVVSLNYLLGKQVIKPKLGKTTAAVSGGLVAIVVAYIFSIIFFSLQLTNFRVIIFGLLIGTLEHMYPRLRQYLHTVISQKRPRI